MTKQPSSYYIGRAEEAIIAAEEGPAERAEAAYARALVFATLAVARATDEASYD